MQLVTRHSSIRPALTMGGILAALAPLGELIDANFAKIVFSAMINDARNKVGGVVFTKGRFGAVTRRKVSPVQPRTQAQSNVRSSFTGLSKQWASVLTDAQRAGWIALAKANPVRDVYGATITLTGLQMFQKLNRALATIGVAEILDPPVSLSAESPNGALIVANHTGPVLTILPTVFNSAADDWVIRAAPSQNAGRTFIGSKMVVTKFGSTVLAAAQAFATEYIAKFGALQVGQRIFASIQYVNKTTGAEGTPAQSSTLVI